MTITFTPEEVKAYEDSCVLWMSKYGVAFFEHFRERGLPPYQEGKGPREFYSQYKANNPMPKLLPNL